VRAAALDTAAFNDLVDASPALRVELMHIVEQRRRANQVQALTALKGDDHTVVAAGLKRRTFEAGEAIIRQGELGESFFIIEDGAVEVFLRNSDGAEVRLDTLKRGGHFGEAAVLGDRRRNVSVRVSPDGPARCIEYAADEFERLAGPSDGTRPGVGPEAQGAIEKSSLE
jgi:cAMP-dependent protein kinase regulator